MEYRVIWENSAVSKLASIDVNIALNRYRKRRCWNWSAKGSLKTVHRTMIHSWELIIVPKFLEPVSNKYQFRLGSILFSRSRMRWSNIRRRIDADGNHYIHNQGRSIYKFIPSFGTAAVC